MGPAPIRDSAAKASGQPRAFRPLAQAPASALRSGRMVGGQPMPVPFYIAQTSACRTPEEAFDWIQKRTDEARAQGAKTTRNTYCSDRDALLIEGWKEAEADVDDDAEPCWQPS